MGDLNAKHSLWRNRKNNRNGHLLREYAAENDIQILHTATPTHYPVSGMTPSYLDLALNKNILDLPGLIVLDELSSDHMPLLLNWETDLRKEDIPVSWTYNNANWRLFREIMNEKTQINNNINTVEQLETEVHNLTENLQFARGRVASEVRTRPVEDRLPREIFDLIKFKNAIRKRWQKFTPQTG